MLPLLFGLVGGASGFTVLKMDLSKPNSQRKLRLIGSALFSCSLACVIALVFGVATKGTLLALQADSSVYKLRTEDLSHRAWAIDRLLLRKRLSAIGATKSEIEILMANTPDSADFKSVSDQLALAVTEFLATYDALPQEDQKKLDGDLGQSPFAKLQGAARIYSMLKSRSEANGPITAAGYRFLTTPLYSIDFASIFPRDSDSKYFAKQLKLLEAIAKVQSILDRNSRFSDPFAQTKQIDEFLKLVAAAKPTQDSNLVANNWGSSGPN
ncbi:hypothetical protein [Bradyrhizobium pachyrhizi]|uniref:hypothetical protein n=1 Tax=Bradyrhizobium pachyrhizi TaxID=280333 RepID=UPI003D35AAEB